MVGCRRVKERDMVGIGGGAMRGMMGEGGVKIHIGEEKGGLTGKMNSIRERR